MSQADAIARLRALVDGPRDGALLRITLANALLAANERSAAIEQARHALRFDADYSAAWKLLGRLLGEAGDVQAAREAYRNGIAAAARRGDKQAEKEMTVFEKRLARSEAGGLG